MQNRLSETVTQENTSYTTYILYIIYSTAVPPEIICTSAMALTRSMGAGMVCTARGMNEAKHKTETEQRETVLPY